jgi:hypothetical protein
MQNRLMYSIDFLQDNYNLILEERIRYKQNITNKVPSSSTTASVTSPFLLKTQSSQFYPKQRVVVAENFESV